MSLGSAWCCWSSFGVSFFIFPTLFAIVLCCPLLSGISRHCSSSFGIIWRLGLIRPHASFCAVQHHLSLYIFCILCCCCCRSALCGVVCHHLVSHSSSFPRRLSSFYDVRCCQASLGIVRLCLASFGILASFVLVYPSVLFIIVRPCTSSASFIVFLVWFGIVRCQVSLGVVHHHSSLFVVIFVLHCWLSSVIMLALSVSFCIGALFGVIHHRSSSFTIVQCCTAHHLLSSVFVWHCVASFGIVCCWSASFTIVHHHSSLFSIVQHCLALFIIVHHHLALFGIVHCPLSLFGVVRCRSSLIVFVCCHL